MMPICMRAYICMYAYERITFHGYTHILGGAILHWMKCLRSLAQCGPVHVQAKHQTTPLYRQSRHHQGSNPCPQKHPEVWFQEVKCGQNLIFYVRICLYLYVCLFDCMHVCICIYVYVCVYVCKYVRMCICMNVFIFVCITCVSVYVCAYV